MSQLHNYLWTTLTQAINHTGKGFRVGNEFIALRLLWKMAEHESTFQVTSFEWLRDILKNWAISRNPNNITLTDRAEGFVE